MELSKQAKDYLQRIKAALKKKRAINSSYNPLAMQDHCCGPFPPPEEPKRIMENLPTVDEVFAMAAEAKRDSLGIMEDPELIEILEAMRSRQLSDEGKAAEPPVSPSPDPQ